MPCRRSHCSLLHEWLPFSDVMNQDKVRELNPLQCPGHPLVPPPTAPVGHLATGTIPMPQLEGLIALQKVIDETQRAFEAQQVTVNEILLEIRQLELKNMELRRLNSEEREESASLPEADVDDVTQIVDSIIDWPRTN